MAELPENATTEEVVRALAARAGHTLKEYEVAVIDEMVREFSSKHSRECVYLYELDQAPELLLNNPNVREHVKKCEVCRDVLSILAPDPELEEKFVRAARDIRGDVAAFLERKANR